jgi:hypothetical protein
MKIGHRSSQSAERLGAERPALAELAGHDEFMPGRSSGLLARLTGRSPEQKGLGIFCEQGRPRSGCDAALPRPRRWKDWSRANATGLRA